MTADNYKPLEEQEEQEEQEEKEEKKGKDDRYHFAVAISYDLRKKLHKIARENEQTLSSVARTILVDYFNKKDKE
jgi:uncharacterized alpha-E superfamily protein